MSLAEPVQPNSAPEPPSAPTEVAATQVAFTPLLPTRLAFAGAVLAGALYCLAFAGLDVWPLTFVCFVPMYLALIGQTPKRALLLGTLTGLSMNLGGFYWLIGMLKTFSGFPTPVCFLFTVIICTYQGGRLALMGWLFARGAVRKWPRVPLFVAAFAASELLFPLLFPWYYAATLHKVPILLQHADIGGPILVGVGLIIINVAIAEPLRAYLETRRSAGGVPLDRRVVLAGLSVLVASLGYGWLRTRSVQSAMEEAESFRVGYVQGNMELLAKRENPGEGLRRHRQLTAELRAKGADLAVWSETSATYPMPEEAAMKHQAFGQRFAASLGIPTIFGAVLYADGPLRRRLYNSAISTDVRGEIRGRYDKQYLLAFGEYLPFGEMFPILYKWSPHSGQFSPGTSLDPVIVDIKGVEHKVSVLICYEDILPGFTNDAVRHAQPELLVNMTNDAWFGDTTEPWQHLALAKLRAVEHRRYLVRSTNSGVSAIIDPIGKIVEGTQSTPFVAEARDGVAHWMKGRTVYESIGNVPWVLASLASVFAAFRRRRDKSA